MADRPVDTNKAAMELALAMTRMRGRLRQESQQQAQLWPMHQLVVLSRIVESGTTTAGELAAAEHVRPQSMTETVAALRRGGLLETSKDPNDGRRTLLRATPAGHGLLDTIVSTRGEWLAGAMDTTLTAAEQRTLVQAIDLLNRLAGAQY
jgi:DNA-binding MarR family transcriptional regulator